MGAPIGNQNAKKGHSKFGAKAKKNRYNQVESKKNILVARVNKLVALKKKLYSKMDITSAMSAREKSLNKRIATIFGNINNLVIQKHAFK